MKISKEKIDPTIEAIGNVQEEAMTDLSELQLMLVGGGCGNEIFG